MRSHIIYITNVSSLHRLILSIVVVIPPL